MDLPRLAALRRYWKTSPPVHQVVARAFGVEPPEPQQEKQPKSDVKNTDNLDDFLRDWMAVGGGMG